jgi:alpha-glucan,water dikinase
MKATETIVTQSGLPVQVETRATAGQLEIVFKSATQRRCLLHWGVRQATEKAWRIPPASGWPAETQPFGNSALQSPFRKLDGGMKLAVRLERTTKYDALEFALYFPEEQRWDNNQGRNYLVRLTESEKISAPTPTSLLATLHTQAGGEVAFERAFQIEGQGQVAVVVSQRADRSHVAILSDIPGNLILHWGIAQNSPHEWLKPPPAMRGPDTVLWQEHTAQTKFVRREGFNSVELAFPQSDAPLGIQFVLKRDEEGGRWINYRGGNFYVPIRKLSPQAALPGLARFQDVADEIVHAEMNRNSWTLMHRFNLCYDLLDRVGQDRDGLALLYVWLRFSAIRQLTWQRNYNTKPRELAHAQDRLTHKFATLYQQAPAARPMLRLMLVTVGRGGEGQQIRDEILNIMHRHHLKEVSGHFLEEWHQKLHNNTTPDDIVICEAFLEFLRSHGNLDLFYQTLEQGGVTRQRLESFERPIRSQPQFWGHLREGLIGDFQHFLAILKASHSSTDLETALNATRNQLGDHLQSLLNEIWNHRHDPGLPLVQLVNRITEARRQLAAHFSSGHNLREWLYLDLALEQLLRNAVERNIHLRLNGDQLTELILHVLENMMFACPSPELAACFRHWDRLQAQPRFGAEWSLRAKSVTERIGRALSGRIDEFYQLLQPKAEYLGHGFQAESWTITLFSEEVIRGGSLGFVLSVLLHHLDPLLRQAAQIGDWQIVSRGRGQGKVEVAASLRSLQRTRFETPTVVLADRVMGDEEIPENVTAVIAPDVTDIVSHVAVRARNARILFASCHDAETLRQLKSLQGRFVQLEVKSDGDVAVSETTAAAVAEKPRPVRVVEPLVPRSWLEKYAVTADEFTEQTVGGKSRNLARLRQRLPKWIHLPASVAVPFGAFERILKLAINHEAAKRYHQLVKQLATGAPETLAALRETVLTLHAPEALPAALHDAMNTAGLPWPDDWEKCWQGIKRVWASKWNERAFLSRQHQNLPHENLFMAVLIQQVVPADYAFVIHTVNPANNNPAELYAEVVLGLGETLVANHPGRALRVVINKTSGHQNILAYPNKSLGLYGGGLIFRSDSNGEDLADYAGAGLYDSVLLEPAAETILDYSVDALVWDEGFRRELIAGLLRVGLEIERLAGAPQDIEGVVAQGKFYVVQTRPQMGVERSP